jgi:DNA-binding transcriptional ArsR family regulator
VHVGAAPGTSKEGLAALANAIAVFQPVLVIVDPVLKLVRVRDSSDYAELTRELEPVIELARRTGCHIAVTHHLGKQLREGGDDVLGSTAIFGAVDTLVLFRRRKDNLRVLQTIQRYGTDLGETVIPMDADTGLITLGTAVSVLKQAETKAKVLEVLEKLGEGETLDLAAVREQTEMQRLTVHHALQELVDEGAVERVGEGRRGNPFRFCVAGRNLDFSVLRSPPIYKEQQNREPENLFEAVVFEEAPPGQQGQEEQQNSRTETMPPGPLCRACGKPLSEAEAAVEFQLHLDCTMLPMIRT